MNALAEGIAAVCTFGVVLGGVSLLLPESPLGETVKRGGRVLLIAILLQTALQTIVDTEDYLTRRLSEEIADQVEEKVRQTLLQFDISDAAVRIDLEREEDGALALSHIAVGIPERFRSDRQSVKDLLLKRFEVFCDVYLQEEAE